MGRDLGEYQGVLDEVLAGQGPGLAFLAREWPEVDAWRAEAREKLLELLAFTPRPAALDARVERRLTHDGLEVEVVSWEVGYGPRCEAWVFKPEGAMGRLPAVLALHDHGGFKWYGKEKIAQIDREYPLVAEHQEKGYGGVAWANALAKEGFLVIVHDGFMFGSRKVGVEALSDRFRVRFRDLTPDTEEHIRAYNGFAAQHEHVLAKACLTAGTTWPGMVAYEDRRAVDYLLTRDDVDGERIGCGGLSGGGLRSVLLAGTDARLRAVNPSGFMCTWQGFLQDRVYSHTWMLYIPYCARYLDFPDILSLHGPKPALVQYDEDDPLYTLETQRDADARLAATYARMGATENYTGSFYPGGHKFDVPMQEEAFAFFKRHL